MLHFAEISGAPACAADVTFTMQNNHPNAVEAELYSPAAEAKQMPLCRSEGEKICCGAWIQRDRDAHCGTGAGNLQARDDCCHTCAGVATETISLDQQAGGMDGNGGGDPLNVHRRRARARRRDLAGNAWSYLSTAPTRTSSEFSILTQRPLS